MRFWCILSFRSRHRFLSRCIGCMHRLGNLSRHVQCRMGIQECLRTVGCNRHLVRTAVADRVRRLWDRRTRHSALPGNRRYQWRNHRARCIRRLRLRRFCPCNMTGRRCTLVVRIIRLISQRGHLRPFPSRMPSPCLRCIRSALELISSDINRLRSGQLGRLRPTA